jgi:hypothetical protein
MLLFILTSNCDFTSEENTIDARLSLFTDNVARPTDEAAVIAIRLWRIGYNTFAVRLSAFLSFDKFVYYYR